VLKLKEQARIAARGVVPVPRGRKPMSSVRTGALLGMRRKEAGITLVI
jgi:hypothetical protein